MKFSKKKMLERIESEGRMKDITNADIETMRYLDGSPVIDTMHTSSVWSIPQAVIVSKDNAMHFVNLIDCE